MGVMGDSLCSGGNLEWRKELGEWVLRIDHLPSGPLRYGQHHKKIHFFPQSVELLNQSRSGGSPNGCFFLGVILVRSIQTSSQQANDS